MDMQPTRVTFTKLAHSANRCGMYIDEQGRLLAGYLVAGNRTEFKKTAIDAAIRAFGILELKKDITLYCTGTYLAYDISDIITPDMMVKNRARYLPGRNISRGLICRMVYGKDMRENLMFNIWFGNTRHTSTRHMTDSVEKCNTADDLLGLFSGGKFLDNLASQYLEYRLEAVITGK